VTVAGCWCIHAAAAISTRSSLTSPLFPPLSSPTSQWRSHVSDKWTEQLLSQHFRGIFFKSCKFYSICCGKMMRFYFSYVPYCIVPPFSTYFTERSTKPTVTYCSLKISNLGLKFQTFLNLGGDPVSCNPFVLASSSSVHHLNSISPAATPAPGGASAFRLRDAVYGVVFRATVAACWPKNLNSPQKHTISEITPLQLKAAAWK